MTQENTQPETVEGTEEPPAATAIVKAEEHTPAKRGPLPIKKTRIQVADLDSIWQLANRYAKCGMLPQGIESVEQMYIAMLAGFEAGLPLSVAAKNVMVVNNRPTIWGDGALALVRANPLCLKIKEWMEGMGDTREAVCLSWRRGEDGPEERRFSVEDARTAKLWGKSGPWTNYPRRMLQMKARAWLLRDMYPDILMGLSIREEVEDFEITSGVPAAERAAESRQLINALPPAAVTPGPEDER